MSWNKASLEVMSKFAPFCCLLAIIVGLGAGYFYTRASAGRTSADANAVLQFLDLGMSSERAQKAYEHESIPIAIHAMTELLDKQKVAEQTGETAYLGRQMISIDLMLTHARLGKLYREAGQTNLSAEHIAEALKYAKANSNLGITNQETLMNIVAQIDKGAR